jgi:hypothetical protein
MAGPSDTLGSPWPLLTKRPGSDLADDELPSSSPRDPSALVTQFCPNQAHTAGVSPDSLKFHPGPPCSILLRPVGGPPPKRPYGRFKGVPPTGQAACGRLLPPWIPHAVQACVQIRAYSRVTLGQHCLGGPGINVSLSMNLWSL